MKLSKCILGILILLSAFPGIAQLSKGMLKMEVAGIKMNGEEAPPEMASVMGSMDIRIYSDGIIQKSVISMMMMKTINIFDTKSDSMHMYMEMMGKKYKISESRKSNFDSLKNMQMTLLGNMDIMEFPKDVKEILGYKCHRVELKMKMNTRNSLGDLAQDVNMIMYVTNDLKFDASYVSQTGKSLGIKGTPLEYNMTMGSGSFQIELTMLAKEYKKEILPEDLLPPPGNYKLYTMQQFQDEIKKSEK